MVPLSKGAAVKNASMTNRGDMGIPSLHRRPVQEVVSVTSLPPCLPVEETEREVHTPRGGDYERKAGEGGGSVGRRWFGEMARARSHAGKWCLPYVAYAGLLKRNDRCVTKGDCSLACLLVCSLASAAVDFFSSGARRDSRWVCLVMHTWYRVYGTRRMNITARCFLFSVALRGRSPSRLTPYTQA